MLLAGARTATLRAPRLCPRPGRRGYAGAPLRLAIVGGVAGGATAAARARRLSESADIQVFERGPDVSFANCGLPYHISGEIADRRRLLLHSPESLGSLLNVGVHALHEVQAVDRARKALRVRELRTQRSFEVPYDKLILSTGAAPVRPAIPGADLPGVHVLRSLQDMDAIVASARRAGGAAGPSPSTGRRALVVGAGFIGLEVAEALARLGFRVHLLEQRDQVLPQLDAELAHRLWCELRLNGVEVHLQDSLTALAPAPDGALLASFARSPGGRFELAVLAAGVRPESGLGRAAGLAVEGEGEGGAVLVNEHLQTSDPDVYAVGDAVLARDLLFPHRRAWTPLAGPANRQARLAADHIFLGARADAYRGSLGTAVVRVFDTTAAVTGWTEARLRAAGIAHESATVSGPQHASYFPGAAPLVLKVLWETHTGRLLGAQAVGREGADKRIDVVAGLLLQGAPAEALAHLELCYAPPYASARDVLHLAGFAAQNARRGLVRLVHALPPPGPGAPLVLDVRDAAVAALSPVPGAAALPLDQLRRRLGELDAARALTAVCAQGKSSYFAARILAQHGFDVSSLSGGLSMLPSSSPDQHSSASSTPASSAASSTSAPLTAPPPAATGPGEVVVDACGLACPGPIVAIRGALDALPAGGVLAARATDPGFANDFEALCRSLGLQALGLTRAHGVITGRLRKPLPAAGSPSAAAQPVTTPAPAEDLSVVVFSGELDKLLAALVITNGFLATSPTGRATLFFTFWGLTALRTAAAPASAHSKPLLDRALGALLPAGADQLHLSHLDLLGVGTWLMKSTMRRKHLPELPELLASARRSGRVRLVACSMSMSALGISRDELLPEAELGGVADFLAASARSRSTLFI